MDGIRIAFRFYRGTVRRTASRLAKLSRRVSNHSGRVLFYTQEAFRTVSAGVANADSALPYFINGTLTQDIINGKVMKEHKKTVRHLNKFFFMKSTFKSTE